MTTFSRAGERVLCYAHDPLRLRFSSGVERNNSIQKEINAYAETA